MKQSPKKESLVLGKLLKQLGPTINAKVVLEPEWGIAGQITFQSGKRCYFRYNTLDLNPVGASDIAKDKDYANYFLRLCGYPTIPGSKTFFSDAWASAIGAKRRRIDNAYVYAKTLVDTTIQEGAVVQWGADYAIAFFPDGFSVELRVEDRDNRCNSIRLSPGSEN
nr:Unknown Function [uncultured bacterium]